MNLFFLDERAYTINYLKSKLKKNTAKRKKLQRQIKKINRDSHELYNYLNKYIEKEGV